MSYKNELQFFRQHAIYLLPRDVVVLDQSGMIMLFLVHDAAKRFPDEMSLKENDVDYLAMLTSYYASLADAAEDVLKYKPKNDSRASDRLLEALRSSKNCFTLELPAHSQP
ncbi:hypothetical protein HK405_010180 [Cladochytrium tenue]|nr:hypothetical protein HK405_010180 [Cladochytrium tenue]